MSSRICKLCYGVTELRNSHILPEFLYTDIYDELHRTLLISKEKEMIVQKGIREQLLCQKCESRLSKYEKYAKELLQRIPGFPKEENLGILYSDDVDYYKFKLFQLSILWRAGIASHDAFRQVDLGSKHEERIRIMLVEENPGRVSDYGCLMSIILKTELLHKVIQSPTRFVKKLFDHNACKFVTGNLTWVFIVSSHKVQPWMQGLFLQESGLLRVMLSRRDEQAEITEIGKNIQRLENGI